MIRAYDEIYLNDAMNCLGEAMDCIVYDCGMDMDFFLNRFIVSGLSDEFGCGSPRLIAGISGSELVMNILNQWDCPDLKVHYDYSPEYWCGWILAYYQWYSGRTFSDIRSHLCMQDILRVYPALHEAPRQKFAETADRIILSKNLPTRLQSRRKTAGYSQRQLSEKSGVNIRTLQQYESRAKDINKASGTALFSLSRRLGCRMEDLMEYEISVEE